MRPSKMEEIQADENAHYLHLKRIHILFNKLDITAMDEI